jgi:hypothetical protein
MSITKEEFTTLPIQQVMKKLHNFMNSAQPEDEYEDSYSSGISDFVYSLTEEEIPNGFVENENFEITLEHEVGDSEGGGEHSEKVFSLKVDDNTIRYAQITGYYASYDGTTWDDDWTEVYPKKVTVTKFFNKP